MKDASLPVQIAVIAVLNSCEDLRRIVEDSIYDDVPEGEKPPYVTPTNWQDLEAGTDISDSHDVTFDVQCHSDAPGRDQVTAMAGIVQTLLHQFEPDIPGFGACEIILTGTLYFKEPDGVTYRAVVSFRALIDESY